MAQFLGEDYASRILVEDWRRDAVAETINGRMVASTGEAQRWDVSFGLRIDVNGRRGVLRKIQAHRRQNRFNGVFDVEMPQPTNIDGPEPEPSSDLVVVLGGKADAGASSIVVRRTSPAATRYDVPIGRYIRIAGDDKVYAVLEARTMPAANTNYTLKIYPSLRRSSDDGSAVDFTPNMRARWHPDSIGIEPEEEGGRAANIVNYLCRFAEAI